MRGRGRPSHPAGGGGGFPATYRYGPRPIAVHLCVGHRRGGTAGGDGTEHHRAAGRDLHGDDHGERIHVQYRGEHRGHRVPGTDLMGLRACQRRVR